MNSELQPAWITCLARICLAGSLLVVAIAILLSDIQMATLRGAWPWLGLKIDQVERIWPAIDMVHVVMFFSVGLLAALAFSTRRARWLLAASSLVAIASETVQIWIPGRTASAGEALLDIVAAVLGMGMVYVLRIMASSRFFTRSRPETRA